ncbi:hypothetical protein [Novosphingobium sp. ST904]|uniref:hypothetical protein n=2 Tax=Novosphingobium sp. ST904 TaxID=1684385 RepID=UPI0006C8654E|nr:hypothetical protein [Novosphingobium sp. ST904]
MVVSTLAAWPEKLSADLIIRATCRWSRAQCRGLTCIPLLHRLFTPLGLTMIAPSFASLLTMFEAAAGRPIEIGARDRPSQDQLAICAILTTANAPAVPFLPDMLEPSHPLSSTIDCAVASIRLLVHLSAIPFEPIAL